LAYGILSLAFVSPPIVFPVLIFLAILGVYGVQRLIKNTNSPLSDQTSSWVKKPVLLIPLFFLCAILLYWRGINSSIITIFLLSLFVSFWYVVPFFKIKLREVPYLKTPLVALIWSLFLVYIPLSYYKSDLLFPLSILYFIYFFALAIPFDIKDLDLDSAELRNIPQIFGMKGAKMISIFLMIIFYSLSVFNFPQLQFEPLFWISLFHFCVTTLALTNKSSYFHYSLIDSSMILLGLSMMDQFKILQ
jgi:hypothetical protein